MATAIMMRSTSTGAEVGVRPKTVTSRKSPIPPQIPRPIPVYLEPTAMTPKTTKTCRMTSMRNLLGLNEVERWKRLKRGPQRAFSLASCPGKRELHEFL